MCLWRLLFKFCLVGVTPSLEGNWEAAGTALSQALSPAPLFQVVRHIFQVAGLRAARRAEGEGARACRTAGAILR